MSEVVSQTKFINSGSILLNLALTGRVNDGWPLGRMVNIIGDKSTGKTLLAIEAATMFLNFPPEGIKPKVVYAEAESAFDEAYAHSLGMPVEDVEFPKDDERIDTIEKLYFLIERIAKEAKKDEGYLVVLDSFDALTSEAELNRDIDDKSFGDGKAKKAAELFRKLVRVIEDSNICLMVISQIRENINAGPFAPKWRRAGGKSLDFYATHLVWLYQVGQLKNKKLDTVYGVDCQVKVTKNKVSKPFREVEFPILFSYGTDNIGGIIEFLSKPILPINLRIQKSQGQYTAWNNVEKMAKDDLVKHVENNMPLYQDLVKRTQDAWDWIENEVKIERKSKTDILRETVELQTKAVTQKAKVTAPKPDGE